MMERNFLKSIVGVAIMKLQWLLDHLLIKLQTKRDSGQIIAHIVNPKSNYQSLGYKRTAMPAFSQLNAKELQDLTNFILSFKDK